jgi:DNA-binding MurR/RpiR family transcriptional regulator
MKTREVIVLTPTTFNELKDVIAENYPTLSRQLQKIARFVLEYPEDMALETVAVIAKRTAVQPSSMIRFAQALGFDGFSDMQQIFRTVLVTRPGNYRDRIETLRRQSEVDGADPGAVLADSVEESIHALQLLGENTATEDLNRAIELLADANDIYVLAERRAFPVAFYLTYAIGRLDRTVHLLDGIGGMLNQQASNIKPQDAIIVISFPPYSPTVVELLAEQSQSGVTTVSITDSAISPIAMEATVTFGIKQQEERAFRSLVAPMCLAQSLVVGLGHRLVARNHKDGKSSD